jgi:hypothetical protein
LNLYNFTKSFFTKNDLIEERLFLLETTKGSPIPSISEPNPYNFPENENDPLTDLNINEKNKLIKEKNVFDKDKTRNPIKIKDKNYYIASTSNTLPNSDSLPTGDYRFPIEANKNRHIIWEWVLLRSSTTDGEYITSDLGFMYNQFYSLQIITVIVLILLSIGIIISYNKIIKFNRPFKEKWGLE